MTFDDVRGQDAIVKTLKNQITTGRIGHAYLFSGTRGTGKTSIAKIFARAVNCEDQREGNPCNECASCSHILEGSSINVFEIDAAGNNGVDNIRDIKEQVEYPPTEGRYKVYIIDEVHMLSTGAFNALLKTLEEPPEYVIVILATTDPQKIPQTIISRCQRYDFKRISTETICKRLLEMKEREGYNVEDRALRYIALKGDGSMRDALSLFDRCLSFKSGESLGYEDVLDILGSSDASVYSRLFNAAADRDAAQALRVINDIISEGKEVMQALSEFILYLRNLLIKLSTGAGDEDILDVSQEEAKLLFEDSKRADKAELLKMISRLSQLMNRMRFAPQKRVLFEAEMISLIYEAEAGPSERHAQDVLSPRESSGQTSMTGTRHMPPLRGPELEKREERKAPEASEAYEEKPKETPAMDMPRLKECRDTLSSIRENWPLLVRELSGSNKVVFQDTELEAESEGVITVIFTNSINYKLAATNKSENGLKKLEEISRDRLNANVRFTARLASPEVSRAISDKNKITEEELSKIHFHVDRQEE